MPTCGWTRKRNRSCSTSAARRRAHSSFEELLDKEKQKKEAVDERFSQAKSLEQAKKKKATEFFEQTIKEK